MNPFNQMQLVLTKLNFEQVSFPKHSNIVVSQVDKNVFHYLCCLPEVELIPYSSSPCREVSERVLGVGCVMFVEWSWRNQETPEKKSLDL